MIFLIWGVFLLRGAALQAQTDSALLTQNFRFEDGLYRTFAALRDNRPDYPWKAVDLVFHRNPESLLARMESIKLKSSGQSLNPREFWGFVYEGVPFIRLDSTGMEARTTIFAGFKVRGRLCYYEYQSRVVERVEVKAYNPLTGRPFRQATVSTPQTVTRKRMLDFRSGEIIPFTKANLLARIRGADPRMEGLVEDIDIRGEKAEQKLYEAFKIYLDRHPVRVPVGGEE